MSVLTTAATGIGISYSITCVLEKYNIPYATADYQARGGGGDSRPGREGGLPPSLS